MERLIIAVDPGFDSYKVIANLVSFKFPANVVETDERKMSDWLLRDDFMLLKSSYGTTYRIGQYAREKVFEDKFAPDDLFTDKRFVSDEFTVGLNTAIALAIEKNGYYDIQDELDIYLIVALPHAQKARYSATIVGDAAGRHNFTLRLGKGAEKPYSFSIKEQNIKTISQTIASILGETSDASGYIDEAKARYINDGPTLVLDGGYYTFGMASVSRGGSVDDDKAESETEHAMKNVNIRICKEIEKVRPDIKHTSVEYLLSKDEGIIKYVDENGKSGSLDLKALKARMVREVCEDFIEYLNKKYNKLVDFKYVLVTGGTGATFYPILKEYYCDKLGLFDENHLVLTNTNLLDKRYSIEFAIVVGAYKGLMSFFSV